MQSSDQVIVKAHAKLNLSLCVDGKMPDDFHRIRSLICPLTLHDTIRINVVASSVNEVQVSTEFDSSIVVSEAELSILNSPKNLAYRAADLFLGKIDSKYSIKIKLLKRIPTQAGLGGGSSDAASVLLGLSSLLRPQHQIDPFLTNLASALGSDVVSFIFGGMIFVHGRGDKYSPLYIHKDSGFYEYLNSLQVVLLKPPVGVETAWAYKNLNRQQILKLNEELLIGKLGILDSFESMGISVRELPKGFVSKPCNLKPWVNDFEPTIRQLVPDVDKAFNELYNLNAEKVILAGSGSCVAGIYTREIDTSSIISNLRKSLGDLWFIAESRFCA